MIRKVLIAFTLVAGFSMPVQSQITKTLKLPVLPECNIQEDSCNEEYYNLFVEFKTIKEFFEKDVISEEIYKHYKTALDKLDAERIYRYQERFIENQKSYFVEIPTCSYDSTNCIEEYESFFALFQQAVLLCNQGELDKKLCVEYVTRIQRELTSDIEKHKSEE